LQRLAAIRNGDESAFEALVDEHHRVLHSLARAHCQAASVEDVVQETWATFLTAVDRFEGRSSLRTSLIGICLNVARAKGRRERAEARPPEGPTVASARFLPEGHVWAGHWAGEPMAWPDTPERSYLGAELRRRLQEALDHLPPAQREVLVL